MQAIARADGRCELCGARTELRAFEVPSRAPRDASIAICDACETQLKSGAALEPSHWRGLESAIWSEVPAVQVASYRMLERLRAEGWASALLDQAYLADELLAWANESHEAPADDERVLVKDSNGALLADGDAVTLIKDLDVKGAGFTAKRGTLVKSIRLTDDPRHLECRVNGIAIVLKT